MNTERLIEFRRDIHAHPELSNEERQTAAKVHAWLQELNIFHSIKEIGDTGIIAEYDSGKEGPHILLRAELDALPIEEINNFEYRSSKKHVSHMCGHDGHLTSLLGVALGLSMDELKKGKLSLLFQPGEENGTGAKAVLNDENVSFGPFDYVIAYHNLPGYPRHSIVVKDESFTAHVVSVIIQLNGKTSHAAEPELGFNPGMAVSDILALGDLMNNNDPERSDFFLVTPVHINMGDIAYGISAGHAEIHLTLRAWTKKMLKKKAYKLMHAIEEKAALHHIDCSYEWTHEFFANKNDAYVVETIREVARAHSFDLIERKMPFKWGEDFGLFTQHYKGAMFGIGSGEDHPALHNPDYDFPDEILDTAIKMFRGIVNRLMD